MPSEGHPTNKAELTLGLFLDSTKQALDTDLSYENLSSSQPNTTVNKMNSQTNATLSASSFRTHYDAPYVPIKMFKSTATVRPKAAAAKASSRRHWLLDSDEGRDLLKLKLKREVPGTKTSVFGNDEHLDADLDHMIDLLGLRNWAKPVGFIAKIGAFFTLVKFHTELSLGYSAPSFRGIFRG